MKGLLYPALNHQALGQAMVTFTGERSLRESMAAGRQIVEERFSVQRYLAELYRAYGVDVAHICNRRSCA